MIYRLEWDSRFFKHEIGKINVSNPKDFDLVNFQKKSFPYKLVYIFSNERLIYDCLKLVDTKLTFLRKTQKLSVQTSNLTFFNLEKDSFESLEKLALLSGEYSRFQIDENFKSGEYKNLYKQWIYNKVFQEEDLDIIIYKEDNLILGFTILEKINHMLCNISLVAVDSKSRGKKIGTKLIEFTINQAFINNFQWIKVITQQNNTPATNLYRKCNFKLDKTEYIYHYWNL